MTDREAADVLSAYSDFLQGRGEYKWNPRSRREPSNFADRFSMRTLHQALDYVVERLRTPCVCTHKPETHDADDHGTKRRQKGESK